MKPMCVASLNRLPADEDDVAASRRTLRMRRLPDHAIQTSQNMRREVFSSIRPWVRAAAAAVLLGGSPAAAQDYPNKPVRIVVGFAAGSASDLVARALALGDGSQERRDPQPDRRAPCSRRTQAAPIASCVRPGHPTGSGSPFLPTAIPIGGGTMGARVGSIRKS